MKLSKSLKYCLWGSISGLIFPLLGFYLLTYREDSYKELIFSLVCTSPVVIGTISFLLGKKLDDLKRTLKNLEKSEQKLLQSEKKITSLYNLTKKEEALIIEYKKEIETILNNIDAGVIIIDQSTHKIEFVNKTAAQMAKALPYEMKGKVCHNFICPAEAGNCPISDQGKKIDSSERVLRKKNGANLEILKTVKPIKYNDKICLIETFTDISTLKENHKKMQEMMHNLVESEKKLADFANDLSRANNIMLNREERILEIKEEVNSLLRRLGEKEKYKSVTEK